MMVVKNLGQVLVIGVFGWVFCFGCRNSGIKSGEENLSDKSLETIFLAYDMRQGEIGNKGGVFEENYENEKPAINNQEISGEEDKTTQGFDYFEMGKEESVSELNHYQARLGYKIGWPKNWGYEANEDDSWVKFYFKEEISEEEQQSLEVPVILFYVRVREKPQQELNKDWFYGNFYDGENIPQDSLEDEGRAIKIVNEEKGTIGNLSFYYLYYFAYTPYPIISYYFLVGSYLYEISFISAKALPTFSEDEEFKDFAKKIVLTFEVSDLGFTQSSLSQKVGALVGEMPHFSQNDPQWKNEQLGFCPGWTIGSGGCAITSAAMVYNYYSPNYTNPGKLNQCLKEKGGYENKCEIIWANSCRPLSLPVSIISTSTALAKKLEKYPVIVWTSCKYSMHFVVAIQKSGNDFLIIDPIDGQEKLLLASGYCFVSGIVYEGEYQGAVFSCEAGPKNPSNVATMTFGEERIFELDFKNTGTVVWTNEKGKPNYIELWSADKTGAQVDSFLAHPSWISPKIVMTLPNGSVDPNVVQKQVLPSGTARFVFKVKVPSDVPSEKLEKNLDIYFIPALAGKTDKNKCWGNAHFTIYVKGECKSGEVQKQGCGKCGEQSRSCVNGKWSAWSACQGEGECYFGKDQDKVVSCGPCATQTLRCNSKCMWEPITDCIFGGQCVPQTSQSKECGTDVGECKKGKKTIYCTNDCLWPSWDSVPCVGEVGPQPEVCDWKDNDCNGKVDEPCFKPVYRFYYSKGGDKDHFLKNDSNVPSGYVIENGGKPVFYTYKSQASGTNPLFRLYNAAIKDHMYTDSEIEVNSAMGKGYVLEGNIGYCATSQKSGTIPLYRCWSVKYSDHLSTTNKAECNAEGYVYEEVTCYVWPP